MQANLGAEVIRTRALHSLAARDKCGAGALVEFCRVRPILLTTDVMAVGRRDH